MKIFEKLYEDIIKEIGLMPFLGSIALSFLLVVFDIYEQSDIKLIIAKWIGFTFVLIMIYYLRIKYRKHKIKTKSFNDVIQRIKNLPDGLNILYTLYKFPQKVSESKNCVKEIPSKYKFVAGSTWSYEYDIESDLFWTTTISDLIIYFSKIKIDELNYIIRFEDIESRNFEFNENLYNYLEEFFKKVSLKEIDDLEAVITQYKNREIL